ncbi:lipase family protein [Demetria terragena]|uniref:lipase family protein n=1 Tax=Demetria terragena TaxID=63959 RepID=UPI00035DE65C|nr:lipase family protein [Demetria terragena]
MTTSRKVIMMVKKTARWGTSLMGVALVSALISAPPASAADDFFTYDGAKPLADYEPGAVLKTRTISYRIAGIPTPLKAVQLLYRTTNARGEAVANTTSVVRSAVGDGTRAVSYGSVYDSLDVDHSPSRAIAGNVSIGGAIANFETTMIAPMLLKGYTVLIPDTEGPTANFAAGPEYGQTTLDSIRAASVATKDTGLNQSTKVALAGYSGGAIASNWAAQLAPTYAPEVNKRLVGVASGGVLVNPARNLEYVGGSLVWAGVAPMAIIGVARAYDIDFGPYLNDYGRKVFAKLDKASIVNALGQYPGLKWKDMVKPQYADPRSVPPFVEAVNKVNMGQAGSPTIPTFMGQGAGGFFEGTSGTKPGIGAGDAVMVAGDVRSLARKYCTEGTPAVKYDEYTLLSHVAGAVPWYATALPWISDRFAGKKAPSDCGRIRAGNSLAPLTPMS